MGFGSSITYKAKLMLTYSSSLKCRLFILTFFNWESDSIILSQSFSGFSQLLEHCSVRLYFVILFLTVSSGCLFILLCFCASFSICGAVYGSSAWEEFSRALSLSQRSNTIDCSLCAHLFLSYHLIEVSCLWRTK